ncbi:MAG: exodeoxyribonuclease VII large subunit [Methylacidiphilales bacterium]|nr:exodeoxyribonuclease VII large subunit [Candidatus Methylacidiphilales bacterium]
MNFTEPYCSVSELTQEIKKVLEYQVAPRWIRGEIGNMSEPSSGHWYFNLKDANSMIRCCMFKFSQSGAAVKPREGMEVILFGTISVYVARGETQIIVSKLVEFGVGALAITFELLKKKLEAEGLFAQERKKELPTAIDTIALITSPTGAAQHDVVVTLEKRWPLMEVNFYHTTVQGQGSVEAVCHALQQAYLDTSNQVILLVRGGGSLEDLWTFNEEKIIRLIAKSPVPIISGIGHENDFTLTDFVADVRASTPTAAAVLVTLDQFEVRETISHYSDNIKHTMYTLLEQHAMELDYKQRTLAHHHPHMLVEHLENSIQNKQDKLQYYWKSVFDKKSYQLSELINSLRLNNPMALLQRGYAIVQDQSGRLITDSAALTEGQVVKTKVATGEFSSKVTSIDSVK